MRRLGFGIFGTFGILAVSLCAPRVAWPGDDPFHKAYEQSLARMAQPDESFATVALSAHSFAPLKPIPVDSKTCSQRCSTRCSVSCTTTRGCSTQCKVQTEGCSGTSGKESHEKDRRKSGDQDASVVDLNAAPLEELQNLPGIGETEARKIVSGRPYKQKTDLVTRGILSSSTYEKIKAWVIVKSVSAVPIDAQREAAVPAGGGTPAIAELPQTPARPESFTVVHPSNKSTLRLERGMTQAKITEILGRPKWNASFEETTRWAYDGFSVIFDRGLVARVTQP